MRPEIAREADGWYVPLATACSAHAPCIALPQSGPGGFLSSIRRSAAGRRRPGEQDQETAPAVANSRSQVGSIRP